MLDELSPEHKALLERQLATGNIEQALSRLRRIAGLLDDDTETVRGVTGSQARELDVAICAVIVSSLDVRKADLAPAVNLASWAGRAEYHLPLEIFTVNYDLLIETALEEMGGRIFRWLCGRSKGTIPNGSGRGDSC